MKNVLTIFSLIAITGCASFCPMHKDAFVDGEGELLIAEYGVSSKPYTYKMVSPANGVEVECNETKMVRATLPSGERITCYICQNDSPKGTMYMTRDRKWKYLTIGLASRLYMYYPPENEYMLVFDGTVCTDALDDKKR